MLAVLNRLGLGASASAHHAARAEELKLRNQLLNHSKKHKPAEEVEDPQPSNGGVKRKAEEHDEDSEDEEESRAGAIRSKSSASTLAIGHGKAIQKSSTTTQSIKNPFAPGSVPPISASSFYSLSAATSKPKPSNSTAPDLSGLTKNQRKKERERQRKLTMAEQAKQEILAEETIESSGTIESPAPASPHFPGKTKKKEKRIPKPPFAPAESSPGTSANEASPAPPTREGSTSTVHGKKDKPLFNPASSPSKLDRVEGVVDGDLELEEASAEVQGAPSSPVKSDNGSGVDGEGKKNKKKKRRKSKAGGETEGAKPLLNL